MEIYEVPHSKEQWLRIAFGFGMIVLIIRIILKIGELLEVFLFYGFIEKM
ncbi:MAG: hypothetical protein Q8O83_01935 [bacterium]|nr:hypothetical protein [bacterium]